MTAPKQSPSTTRPAKQAGKSIADFRSLHDKAFIVPTKIKAALEALGDGWEYEQAFVKLANISVADMSAYRDQFEEFFVIVGGKTPKRVWCGTKQLATKLREMV